MATMLEKMASAMYCDGVAAVWAAAGAETKAHWITLARAALEAIREPDETVADAIAYGVRVDGRGDPLDDTGAEAWRGAIDAILNDSQDEAADRPPSTTS